MSPYTGPQPEEPRDDRALPEHRVAMVVFTTVRAVDQTDAAGIVRHAVRNAVRMASIDNEAAVLLARFRDARVRVQVHELMDLGMAAGNGYVWIHPTAKAYPRRDEAVSDADSA